MAARWLLALLASLPLAAAADDERARIAAEREALTARFAQEELECQRRFAVNDCLDDVRRRSRDALAPLRAREFELDDAERLQRAAERRAAIEARQRERDARPPSAALPDLPPREPAVPALPPSAAAVVPRRADSAQAATLEAQQRAQAAQRRRDEAAAAQERVQRRLREREAAGKAAAPLPVPASAPM